MHPQEPHLYRAQHVYADPDGTMWAELHDANVVPLEPVIELLNIVEPLVSKLQLVGELSPLVEDAPLKDHGRVAIGLLELCADYSAELERVLRDFSDNLPHGPGAESHREECTP